MPLFRLYFGDKSFDRIEAINLDDTTIELQVSTHNLACCGRLKEFAHLNTEYLCHLRKTREGWITVEAVR